MLKDYLTNKENYHYLYDHYIPQWRDKNEQKRLSDYLDLSEEIPWIYTWDLKFEIEVELWLYVLTVVGKIDCIHNNWDVSDIKTYNRKRKYWEEFDKLQPYFYTYWFRNSKWVETWDKFFRYYNFSKHKRDRCELDIRTMTINLEETKSVIIDVCKDFVIAKYTESFPAKTNQYCRACSLYKENKCYLHNWLLTQFE